MADLTHDDRRALHLLADPTSEERDDMGMSLPSPRTSFVGREREVAIACDLLHTSRGRLVTLTGPGGVGKTRLATSVAQEVAGHFADGVLWVDLAPVSDPALVLPTIASILRLGDSGDQSITEQLIEWLGQRALLLVLDNVEHLLSAALQLSTLLARCPQLKILATSRSVLRLSGEHDFPIPPLPLPPAQETVSIGEAAASAAVCLFVDRARAVRPDFALTDGNAAVVASICQRLDGLPLAIELASARIAHLPLATLQRRLEHRLPLLTGGPRDLPARLQTMRDAIGWSYDLLLPEEQTLFRRLAVFVGGFTLEAAEKIVGSTERQDIAVLDGIASLVGKSLLQTSEEPSGEPRYRMLETVREFARERLEESGDADVAHDRLLDWLIDRAATPRWRWDIVSPGDPDGRGWFGSWERELPNVRAALGWAEAKGEDERLLQLAGDLVLFWWSGRHADEGRAWLERGLISGQASVSSRAMGLAVLGALAHRRDDSTGAADLACQARALCEEVGDEEGVGYADYLLGLAAYRQGDRDDAARLYTAALARMRPVGNVAMIGHTLLGLAHVARDRGDAAGAAAAFEEALTLQDAAGHGWSRALACYGCATALHSLGDLRAALARYRESLRYWEGIGDLGSIAVCLEGIAWALCGLGDARRAALLLGAAQKRREEGEYPMPERALASFGHIVAGVHERLGPEAFAQAWLTGRAWSCDDAIAEAWRADPRERGEVARLEALVPDLGARFGLSTREREVLALLVAGRKDREIAEALFLAPRTITTHVSNLLGKLGVANRAEAAALATREGLT